MQVSLGLTLIILAVGIGGLIFEGIHKVFGAYVASVSAASLVGVGLVVFVGGNVLLRRRSRRDFLLDEQEGGETA